MREARRLEEPPRLSTELINEPFLEFTVVGNPRVKERPRVVHGHAYTPRDTAGAELVVAWEAKAAMSGRKPATVPLRLEAAFYMATARRCDADNLLKLVADAANGVVWDDDNQLVDIHVWKLIDRERPRTEVRVWEAF